MAQQPVLTWVSYLVVPDFFDARETTEMLNRAQKLLNEFDIEGHPLVSVTPPETAYYH